jgi:hypothetical protein
VHDWYDWIKDVVLPAITGGGLLVVGIASFRTARNSSKVAAASLRFEKERDARAERVVFGGRVRAHAEGLRAQRILGRRPAYELELPAEHAALSSAASASSQPHATKLLSDVVNTMNDEWGTGSMEGQMLMAMTVANSLIDIWINNPEDILVNKS